MYVNVIAYVINKYRWLLLVFVSQSHVRAHLLLRTIVLNDYSIGWKLSLFFSTVYVDRVTCLLILQCFLRQSGTKKEAGRYMPSRTLESRADSALTAARVNRILRGNYAKCDSSNTPCLRKHARVCSVHYAANALDIKRTG